METTNAIAPAEMGNDELQAHGRQAAARYLEMMGHEVLDRDWSCKWGGIDIVIRDCETEQVAFVEVRTRQGIEAGIPSEDVTASKQRELERVAMSWMVANEVEPGTGVRFDRIGICVTSGMRALLRHHCNIFNGVFED